MLCVSVVISVFITSPVVWELRHPAFRLLVEPPHACPATRCKHGTQRSHCRWDGSGLQGRRATVCL